MVTSSFLTKKIYTWTKSYAVERNIERIVFMDTFLSSSSYQHLEEIDRSKREKK